MLDLWGSGARRRRAWPAAVALVTAATLGAACGDEGGGDEVGGGVSADRDASDVEVVGFEATGSFLASASERSAAEPYRFEMSMSMAIAADGESFDVDAPLGTGEVAGDAYASHIDMGEYFAQLTASMGAGAAAGMPDLDLTMDTVVEGETLWLRAPMFAQLGQLSPTTALPPAFAELGDGWGRVDLTALGDDAVGDLQRQAGSPTGGDPREVLTLLESAGDVTELGRDAVDGDPVDGLGATMSMADLAAMGGADIDQVTEQAVAQSGGGITAADAELIRQTMREADMPIEAWVDAEGYVRRIVWTIDMGTAMAGIAGAEGLDEFTMGTVVEFADYGDESIAIAPPPEAADAVDLTAAYGELTAAGG